MGCFVLVASAIYTIDKVSSGGVRLIKSRQTRSASPDRCRVANSANGAYQKIRMATRHHVCSGQLQYYVQVHVFADMFV
jgi:hypothetical protein